MNTSYNHADFIGMSLESDEDYEPYGYSNEMLQTIEEIQHDQSRHSIESIMFGSSIERFFND